MKKITFNECPRPQLVRDSFTILDGKWDFAFDYQTDLWPDKTCFSFDFKKETEIIVPFAYQTKMSGINVQKRYNSVWYQKKMQINKKEGKRYILHFEGADYILRLFVNSKYAGCDSGAYHRMSFDITDFVLNGSNTLTVNCRDDYSINKPRGKQRAKDESYECWYVDTTGIYKSVWIEEVSSIFIKDVKITPNSKLQSVRFEIETNEIKDNQIFKIEIFKEDTLITSLESKENNLSVPLKEIELWELDNPILYDVRITLKDSDCVDQISSYFGFRTLESKNGEILLNGKLLYQKLLLNQGYWKDSDLTSPNVKALYDDIVKMKEMGFNGCRIHQKFEDERFLYYADILGFITWNEMPSMYDNNPTSRLIFEREWMLEIKQAYNHPCVFTYVPFNESWGIFHILSNKEEQEFVNHIVDITKQFDSTRFVISNDGWEHTHSDILTMHHYEQDGDKLHSYFDSIEKILGNTFESHSKGAFANGYSYKNEPIMLTEFGGTAYVSRTKESSNWGYGNSVKDDSEFLSRFKGLIKGIRSNKHIVGYCYTQTSDVQQEVNGLLDENHEFKVDPKKIKDIVDS